MRSDWDFSTAHSKRRGKKSDGVFSRGVIRDDGIYDAEIIFLNDRVICGPKVG